MLLDEREGLKFWVVADGAQVQLLLEFVEGLAGLSGRVLHKRADDIDFLGQVLEVLVGHRAVAIIVFALFHHAFIRLAFISFLSLQHATVNGFLLRVLGPVTDLRLA